MRLFSFSPAAKHLSDYWNALNRRAPAGELARLASQVEPTYLAAIREARDGYTPPLPDPAFADRLERILMSAAAHPGAEAIPLPRIPDWSSSGWSSKRRGRSWRELVWPGTGFGVGSALRVALVLLLIAASIAGFWIATGGSGDDGAHVVVPAGTPEVEASPDIEMYRGNSARTGVVYGPGPQGAPEELWSVNLPTWIQWSPAVVDGVLYAEGGDAGLFAIDATSGDIRWTFDTPSPVTSGPAVVDGVAYFGSDDGTFFAVDTSSQEALWTFPGIRQQSSAAVVDGITYVVTPEGIFYGLDAKTGEKIWQADLGGDAAGAPAVADGLAYMGNGNRQFQAFDAKTGEQRWMFQGDGEGGYATPTIANGVAYITASGSETNRLYAIDAATGDLLWEQSQGLDHGLISATATADRLFSISEDAVLHAFDATNGESIWEFQLDGFVRTVPILSGSTLYVVDNGGFVRAINAFDGQEIWSYPIEGSGEYALTVAGEVVYTGTDLGNLYAITGSDSIIAPAAHAEDGAAADASPSPEMEPSPQVEAGEVIGEAVIDHTIRNADQPLVNPAQAVLAPDGTIWVADGRNHRFQIFQTDGTFVETWGEPGSEDGQFNFGRGNGEWYGSVAFAPDGSFYVAEPGNYRIQQFDANRQFINAWGSRGTENGQFLGTWMVNVDSQGNVWVNDDLRDDVQKFDSEGNWLLTIGGSGSEPGQLNYQACSVIGADDSIWVADPDNSRIQQWASDGTFLQVVDSSSIPGSPFWYPLTIGEEGNLVLVDPDASRVYVLDQTGALVGVWAFSDQGSALSSDLGCLTAIGDGRFAITDWRIGTLLFFHLDPPLASSAASPVEDNEIGQATVELATSGGDEPLSIPSQAVLAPDGTIWVAEGEKSRFQIFSSDGTFIETWGEPGSADGQFNFVGGSGTYGAIAFAPDGSFYVADLGNHRIQYFDSNRQFLGAWGTRGTENGQFISPWMVNVDSQGNVWVSDDLRDDLQKFEADGDWLLTIGGSGSDPGKLDYQACSVVGSDDSIWVADQQHERVQQWSGDGAFVQAIDLPATLERPLWIYALEFDEDGNLVLIDWDGSRAITMTQSGELIGVWTLGNPDGSVAPEIGCMTAIGDGRFAITDFANGTLLFFHLDPPLASSAAATSPSAAVVELSEPGNPTLSNPSTAAQAPDGTIWVTGGRSGLIQIFGPDGSFIESWGEPGSGDGQFDFVRENGDPIGAIAFAPDGSFYVADTGNYRIQHFDADRQFIAAWGTRGTENGQFVSAFSIDIDSNGNIWVSDDLRNDLQKFDPSGRWLLTVGGFGREPGQLDYQGCVTVQKDNSIWVIDGSNRRLQQWASDGTFLQALPEENIPGDITGVNSIAIDTAGNLALLDSTGSQFVVLDPEGNLLGEWSMFDHDGSALTSATGCMAALDDGRYAIPVWEDGTLLLVELEPSLDEAQTS